MGMATNVARAAGATDQTRPTDIQTLGEDP